MIDPTVFITAPTAGIFGYVAWHMRNDRLERTEALVERAPTPATAPAVEAAAPTAAMKRAA